MGIPKSRNPGIRESPHEAARAAVQIENAKKKSQDLIEESIKIIEPFGEKAKNLIDLANFIISRNK